jgi:parvulin-like peptidyl-prolyl isomerase
MVEEFESFIYGDRKPGDCEIVETTYGYHVVFFIGDGLVAWEIDAKSGYVSEIMTKYQDDLINTYKVSYDSEGLNKIP